MKISLVVDAQIYLEPPLTISQMEMSDFLYIQKLFQSFHFINQVQRTLSFFTFLIKSHRITHRVKDQHKRSLLRALDRLLLIIFRDN